jgi:putative intracellular protease/amidase
MTTKNILIPLASFDFDPSEVAIPWQILRNAGFTVTFATADGKRGYADPIMLHGKGLDPWGWIPGLNNVRLFGLFLRADGNARSAYQAMENDARFLNPVRFDQLQVGDFAGLVLPGGHAKKMVQYLENKQLQEFVADFFEKVDERGWHKPVAAVCHGVVLAARSVSKKTNRSILFGKKTTALTWQLERKAWDLTKYLARFWDPNYYRTYLETKDQPAGYMSVEQEVKRALASPDDFLDVPAGIEHHWQKSSGMVRDTLINAKPAWVVRDGNYLSARWPGDVHTLTLQYVEVLKSYSV